MSTADAENQLIARKNLLAGGRGITRQDYILDLVAERVAVIDGYNGFDMQRGVSRTGQSGIRSRDK